MTPGVHVGGAASGAAAGPPFGAVSHPMDRGRPITKKQTTDGSSVAWPSLSISSRRAPIPRNRRERGRTIAPQAEVNDLCGFQENYLSRREVPMRAYGHAVGPTTVHHWWMSVPGVTAVLALLGFRQPGMKAGPRDRERFERFNQARRKLHQTLQRWEKLFPPPSALSAGKTNFTSLGLLGSPTTAH